MSSIGNTIEESMAPCSCSSIHKYVFRPNNVSNSLPWSNPTDCRYSTTWIIMAKAYMMFNLILLLIKFAAHVLYTPIYPNIIPAFISSSIFFCFTNSLLAFLPFSVLKSPVGSLSKQCCLLSIRWMYSTAQYVKKTTDSEWPSTECPHSWFIIGSGCDVNHSRNRYCMCVWGYEGIWMYICTWCPSQ